MRLIDLIKAFPSKPWDWGYLSQNPNITVKDIIENPELPWDWNSMSWNINLTLQFILENIDKNWSWYVLSINPLITLEDCIAFPQLHSKLYPNLKYIRPVVYNYKHFEIYEDDDYDSNITINYILANINATNTFNWDTISMHPNIKLKDVLEHPELPWNWILFSKNPNVTLTDVLEYPELPWDWYCISEYTNITLHDIITHSELPWNWEAISINSYILVSDVFDNPDMPWHWGYLSSNNFDIPERYCVMHCSIRRTQIYKQELIKTAIRRLL